MISTGTKAAISTQSSDTPAHIVTSGVVTAATKGSTSQTAITTGDETASIATASTFADPASTTAAASCDKASCAGANLVICNSGQTYSVVVTTSIYNIIVLNHQDQDQDG
ncbi:hypothetical protein MKZ38_007116 [Zalerion maritima]|uniref:Uncharacterized protein n=1 Tax=Zalerion maritima TaxID=339359 RepID=A0AAD5RIT2_9PEZI|nr:hypothetical protein MKZ38_007116 [Zalerion maritima]